MANRVKAICKPKIKNR
jgi:hypothetical protein